MMNNKGLSTELWWTPTCTSNTSLNKLFTLTWPLEFLYITCITCTIHSGTLTFRRDHHKTFLCTLSRAFAKSTKAKYRFWFFLMYASWICLINIVSVVPQPGMIPNWISSINNIMNEILNNLLYNISNMLLTSNPDNSIYLKLHLYLYTSW